MTNIRLPLRLLGSLHVQMIYACISCRMYVLIVWIWIYIIYAIIPYANCIDCYHCTSLGGEHKECEDTFQTDITTEHLISRNCYYGYFKAHFCIKLKGTREDGSSILVRQCSTTDWGSHCGLIQYEAGGRLEDIDGCLEACDFDGCNSATKKISNTLTVLLAFISWISLRW